MGSNNPWNSVPLEVYEGHMEHCSQLQALNRVMREQMYSFPGAESVAIAGVAGGNGLEHCSGRFRTVYGIDINPEYLRACASRFQPALGDRLRLMEMDLARGEFPAVDLIIADLFIEYVGVEVFCSKAAAAEAKYVSCVIQCAASGQSFVSASPYQSELEGIGRLHGDVDEAELTECMGRYGYGMSYREVIELPDGKRLIRADYCC